MLVFRLLSLRAICVAHDPGLLSPVRLRSAAAVRCYIWSRGTKPDPGCGGPIVGGSPDRGWQLCSHARRLPGGRKKDLAANECTRRSSSEIATCRETSQFSAVTEKKKTPRQLQPDKHRHAPPLSGPPRTSR